MVRDLRHPLDVKVCIKLGSAVVKKTVKEGGLRQLGSLG
jgi:hypothetical protein